MDAGIEDLEEVNEVGPIVAQAIVDFFKTASNYIAVKKLLEHGVKPEFEETGGSMKGNKFIFTGSLSRFSRREAQEKVKMLGGRIVTSISKEADYLVVGDSPGSKLDKAKKAQAAHGKALGKQLYQHYQEELETIYLMYILPNLRDYTQI